MSQALCFNEVTLSPVSHQNNIWIRAVELARALGYADESSVGRIYQRNADEFTPDMTQVIEISDTVNLTVPARIFSLRGCHLLAMFARTPVAKAFRRWVLDVLDKLNAEQQAHPARAPEPSPISRRTDPERKQLTAIINTWVGMAPIHYANARAQVNAHFGVASVDRLTVAQVREAIQWVQRKIDALPAAPQLSLPEAPDMPPLPTEKDLLDFAREVEEGQRQIRNIFTTLHCKMYALETPLFQRAASQAFGRTGRAMYDGGQPVTIQWSFLMLDKLKVALNPTSDHVSTWDNPALCLLEYRAGQM